MVVETKDNESKLADQLLAFVGRRCPRCGGWLYIDFGADEDELACLHCGHRPGQADFKPLNYRRQYQVK